MLYTRHNFEVADFCDTLGVRPQLAGILVTPNGTAATDSYVLLEVSSPSTDNARKLRVRYLKQFPRRPTAVKTYCNGRRYWRPTKVLPASSLSTTFTYGLRSPRKSRESYISTSISSRRKSRNRSSPSTPSNWRSSRSFSRGYLSVAT